jgi:alpha-L-rhamnosidase
VAERVTKAELIATGLRCEHLIDPIGVDVGKPRLGWVVESQARNQAQTAYQILVSGDERSLSRGKADLWDSGKVESDRTVDVEYEGKPPPAHRRCFWKVRVWDRRGRVSSWSEVARWSTGIGADAWEQTNWIGYDPFHQTELKDAPLDGAKWIWFDGDGEPVGKAARFYSKMVMLPVGASVRSAQLCLTAVDVFTCEIKARPAAASRNLPDWKRPGVFDVTELIAAGENLLVVRVGHKSPDVAGMAAKLVIALEGGETITIVSDESWKATDDAAQTGEWAEVRVLGEYGAEPWGILKSDEPVLPPPAYLRRDFSVRGRVRHATVYATALGIFDLRLNGKRVSEDRFNPGWTDYSKRVYYRAYDVTNALRRGVNTLGAILADGWYSGYIGYARRRDLYGNKTRLRVLLHVEHTDGSVQVVGSDGQWKAACGPIRSADFLAGESHDARLEVPGWDGRGFNDDEWSPVDLGAEPDPVISWHPAPPVNVAGEFPARSVTELSPGVYILDVGQNLAGVARLAVRGKPGQKIMLRFAERLNADGTLHTANLRTARATDTYVCRGSKSETWEPRFTFHGFQFIEVTGLTQRPNTDTVVAIALSSATPDAGSFECSDAMVNRLRNNIYWTQRANFIDIPTDCPQRDERLGWTGDAQVYLGTAAFNCDVQAFFDKWLIDLSDSQREDGQFPMVAPLQVAGDDGGPAWADAGVICPWMIYQIYGDRRLLARQYPSMKRFIDFCMKRSTPDLLPPEKYHCFGDWLGIEAQTPNDVIYTAYFARSALLASRAAQVLGETEDAARFLDLFHRVRSAFNNAYVSEDGSIRGDTQTCYVLALAADLLDEEKARSAGERLVADIKRRGWHLSTGFVGTRDLMLVLAGIGRNDVAYRLLAQTTPPSWGSAILAGATSIWERWDGWTPENGFRDPEMNSFSHYAFGAVYQWIVENIGGIRPLEPACKTFVIAPQIGGGLTWANTTYRSPRGEISTRWKLDRDQVTLAVRIPANTRARVHLPAAESGDVLEGGLPATGREGIAFERESDGAGVYSVGPGNYIFQFPWNGSTTALRND